MTLRSFAALAATLATGSALALTLSPLFTVSGNNMFGNELMKEAIQLDVSKGKFHNTMTSPISAYMALSMVLNGTESATRSGLIDVLEIPHMGEILAVDDANRANKLLLDTLHHPMTEAHHEGPSFDPKPPVFVVSNGAWHNNGQTDGSSYEFSPDFRQSMQTIYSAEVGALDFQQADAAKYINSWVNEKTYEMIPSIITPDVLSDMLWVVLNATYFQGSWAAPFHVMGPNSAPEFHLLNGDSATPEMIRSTAYYRYLNEGQYEVVEIPFAKGGADSEFVFYAVLPREGAFQSMFNQVWDNSFWNEVTSSLAASRGQYGSVTMPKFTFKYDVEITPGSDIASALGIDFLFSDGAHFDPMAVPGSDRSKVGLIKQSTKIELDEKGVKAAAATLVGGVRATSMPPQDTFEMVLDRPFFFAIAEKSTGSLLFLGSMVDPTSEPAAE